jgi:hypothetical protein
VAGHALRCARGMGYGGVVLHSHTQVRPTFPFVQFKPLGVGERIRAVLSGTGCGLGQPTLYRARRQTIVGANKWFVVSVTRAVDAHAGRCECAARVNQPSRLRGAAR